MVLTVGTDCSGMEAPLEALRQLGCAYEHVFSSELDSRARAVLAANHAPRIMYGDVTRRDPCATPPVDLYVAGFPCQAYSMMQSERGAIGDDDRRKTPLYAVVAYIRAQRPRLFVLENVRAFCGTPEFERLLSPEGGEASLVAGEAMREYTVEWRVLSPHTHGDVPHSRPRVFLVGRRDGAPVRFPEPVPLTRTVLDCVDESLAPEEADVPPLADYAQRLLDKWGLSHETAVGVIEFNAAQRRYSGGRRPMCPRVCVKADVAPCMLASSTGLYLVHRRRYLTVEEHMRLQGFVHTVMPACLSHRSCVKLLGNSINVPTLAALLRVNLEGTSLWSPVASDDEFARVWRPPPPPGAVICRKSAAHMTPGPLSLPDGWRVDERVRHTGRYAGGRYRLYYAPDGRRFRSLAEVARAYPDLVPVEQLEAWEAGERALWDTLPLFR